MVHVYLSKEAEDSLKSIKKRDKDFNLSSFIQESLIKLSGERALENVDIGFLNKKLEELNFKRKQFDSESKYYEGLIYKTTLKQQEQESRQKQEAEELESKKSQQIESMSLIIKEYFEIKGEKKINELAKEFVDNKEKFSSLFDFMKSKGYKDKIKVEVTA